MSEPEQLTEEVLQVERIMLQVPGVGAWSCPAEGVNRLVAGEVVTLLGYSARDPEGNLWSFGTNRPAG